ncbi:MAG TPA: NFACT family protein, partial [Pyrinomonadaceae bacterium]|nr:NFACT family protein [Pyrinomonadaceae bacterium]
MNDQTIQAIAEEIAPVLVGRSMGKVFQLSRTSLAIDFRPGVSPFLFINVEPAHSRLHLIERRVRELEKQSLTPTPFVQVLRKQLGGAKLASLLKDEDDRIVRLFFSGSDEIGNQVERTLVVQLTGKAANLLLLDGRGHVIDAMRPPRGEGQEVGGLYNPPPRRATEAQASAPFPQRNFGTLSEAIDDHYLRLEAEQSFNARATSARARLRKEIAQREKLKAHLDDDLKAHGNADEHKRVGDLLLANIGTARRQGTRVTLTDYFAEDAPLIELEVDENSSLQEEAARRFHRYTKAKRAAQEIATRRAALENETQRLRARQAELERIIEERDDDKLDGFTGEAKPRPAGAKS